MNDMGRAMDAVRARKPGGLWRADDNQRFALFGPGKLLRAALTDHGLSGIQSDGCRCEVLPSSWRIKSPDWRDKSLAANVRRRVMMGSVGSTAYFPKNIPGICLFLLFLLIVAPGWANAGNSQVSDNNRTLLPASLVSMGSDYAIVVDKSDQRIYAFHRTDEGIRKVFEAVCSTGMNSGSKEKTGDGRTPEGIYFATDRYTERQLTSTYGAMAFNLNYPNFIDHRKGRTGYNIWIHGTDSDLRPFQSNGCVVLNDDDIRSLSRFIQLNKTPIIILDRVQWVSDDLLYMARRGFSDILEDWLHHLMNGSMDTLAGIYEKASLVDKESLGVLARHVHSWDERGFDVSLGLENVSILRHERHAALAFDKVLSYGDASWNCGNRILFLGKDNGRWAIAGDILHEPGSAEQFSGRLARVDAIIDIYPGIEDMVERWRVSWQSSDMEKYASFYASNFRGNGMNRSRWIAYKKRIATINKNISVHVGDLDINPGQRTTRVSFPQRYRSSVYSDDGIKTLYLIWEGGQWKIYREMWEAS